MTETDQVQVNAAYCSVRGQDHRRSHLPNQDAGQVWRSTSGVMVAVADGLGSRPLSHQGARAAVQAAYRAVQAWKKQPGAGQRELVLLIEAYWRLLIAPGTPDDVATTLAFAACLNGQVILGTLGDGLVAASTEEGLIMLTAPEGDFLNQTLALGTAHKLSDWQIRVLSERRCLALVATDGFASDLRTDTRAEFMTMLRESLDGLSPAARRTCLRNIMTEGPHNGDDKTLGLIWSTA